MPETSTPERKLIDNSVGAEGDA